MRSILLTASAITFAALHAQWTNNTAMNTLVRDGAGVTAATPMMCDGPDGSTYISWFDGGSGGYQLRMQRLDANGNALWAAGGIVISDHPQNSALFRYDMKTDHDGNAIVAFQDERTGHLDIVAYKIDPSGQELWGADGVQLTDPSSTEGLGPVIGILSSNDAQIAWNADDASDKWVAVQRIQANGTVLGSSSYQITGPDKYSRPKIIANNDGSYHVQYVKEVGSFPYTCTLHAQWFDALGQVIDTLNLSSKTISSFYFPEPVSDGYTGFYLAFNTSNPNNASLSDVFAQHVGPFGEFWSADGIEVVTGATVQKFTPGCTFISDDLGIMVPVQVTNSGQTQGGIWVQRIDTDGILQLPGEGAVVVPNSANLPSPDGIAASADGAIIVYSEGGFGDEHLKAVRLDAEGAPVWSPTSRTLCSVNSNKDDASCGTIMNGQLVSVWQDDRVGSGIYAQNIDLDGDLGVGIASHADLLGDAWATISRAGEGRYELLTTGTYSGPADLRIMDLQGRTLFSERVTLSTGSDRHELPSLPPTAYLMEVRAGSHVERIRYAAF